MDSSVSKILDATWVDGVFHTHVSMIKPKGKYLLNRDSIEKLWEEYCNEMSDEKKMGLYGIAESPQHYYPVIVDIDIKIEEKNLDENIKKEIEKNPNSNVHIYSEKHVKQVIEIYHTILRKIIDDCSDLQLSCCLFEKKIYSVEKNGIKYYKSGFHLHYPYIFLSRTEHETYINPRVVDALKEMEVFADLGFEDSSSTFDAGVNTKPWLLYGSRKETSQPYLLTKIYDGDIKEITLEEAFNYYQIYDVRERMIDIRDKIKYYLPRILSIILYGRTPCDLVNNLECVSKEKQALKRTTCKENYKTTVEENLKIAEQLMPMLAQFRSEEHDEWMTIGWILYNIGEGCQEALDLWLDFSAKDDNNYDESECLKRWDKMIKKDFTVGTLKFFAKTDNPDLYAQFVKDQGLKYIKESLEGSHTDIAKLLFTEYGTEFICASVASKTWYQFMGHFWEEIEEGVFLRSRISNEIAERYGKLGGEYFQKMVTEGQDKTYDTRIKQVQKLIRNLKSTPFKKNVMSEAVDIFYNPSFKVKLDTNPYLFAFKNGVYDLKMNAFRAGRPEDYISNHSPIDYFNYSPTDKQVLDVHDFLMKVFPDTSLRKYFLDTTSDLFVGGNFQKIVIFWTGEGDNAKSVTQSFVERMLGPLCVKFSTTLITGKKGQTGSAGPELARAGSGVRLGVFEEPDIDEQINAGLYKSLSGNDSYWARDLFEKGKSTREIQPLFHLRFICNGLPRFRHSDTAVWNRTKVLPFESTFVRRCEPCPETIEEQLLQKRFPMDPEFSKKIPGLVSAFAWVLLEHRKSIQGKERFEPEKVRMATTLYRKQNDIYKQYIEERILDDKTHIKIDELHDDFKIWYKNGFPGNSVPTKNDIREYFTKLWGEPGTGVRWFGYRLRTLDDDVKDGVALVLDNEDLVEYNAENGGNPL